MLAETQQHAVSMLGGMEGFNYVVATYSRQAAQPRVVLCISVEAHAVHRVRGRFITPDGAEIQFKFTSPTTMR